MTRPIGSGLPDPANKLDEDLLDRFQCAAFSYFIEQFNPTNGLDTDISRPGSAEVGE